MRYLLDTDTLSGLMRNAPSPALLRRVAAVPPEDQATSSITLGELLYGAHRLGDRSTGLLERIEEAVAANLPVLSFDERAAREYGALRAHLEERGSPIGDADMRIASIAIAHDLIVVAGNTRHFERVPSLTVEPGDTGPEIAARFRIALADLAQANEMTEAELDHLPIGQELRIPQAKP